MAVIQVIVSAVLLFVLFYFLLRALGPEKIGVWSIVIAIVSAARLGEFGLSGCVVKFVAKYITLSDHANAGAVVETAVISIAVLVGILVIPAYPLLLYLLENILPAAGLSDAERLLPYALFSMWLAAIGGVFLSGLDGVQRTDLRSVILIVSMSAHLGLVLVLIPIYGLMGLAFAQIAQTSMTMLFGWIVLRRFLRPLPIIPTRWSRTLFREMLCYGLNLQLSSFLQLMFDPLTKALLSKFGGLAAVTYYEMASRMVLQCRLLLVSANQVMVPVVAGLKESDPARLDKVYIDSYKLLLFMALPLFSALAAVIPIVSNLWIGRDEILFVTFAAMLAIGRFINVLSGPAYFGNLGIGRLRWNTVTHALVGVLNIVLGVMLGITIGGVGVIAASVISLIIGSVTLVAAYHAENNIDFRVLFGKEYWALASICLVSPVAVQSTYYAVRSSLGIMQSSIICFGLLVAMVLPLFWRHPMRAKLFAWAA